MSDGACNSTSFNGKETFDKMREENEIKDA